LSTDPLSALLPLGFGSLCLLFYVRLKREADGARGERRFYMIGLYRSVALAFGIVAVMIGISRILSLFIE
jgi:hypothetical protein